MEIQGINNSYVNRLDSTSQVSAVKREELSKVANDVAAEKKTAGVNIFDTPAYTVELSAEDGAKSSTGTGATWMSELQKMDANILKNDGFQIGGGQGGYQPVDTKNAALNVTNNLYNSDEQLLADSGYASGAASGGTSATGTGYQPVDTKNGALDVTNNLYNSDEQLLSDSGYASGAGGGTSATGGYQPVNTKNGALDVTNNLYNSDEQLLSDSGYASGVGAAAVSNSQSTSNLNSTNNTNNANNNNNNPNDINTFGKNNNNSRSNTI